MSKFLDEILEQPAALKDTLAFYEGGAGRLALQKAIRLYRQREVTEIILTGMGSSFFTSYLASCLLNEYGIPAHAIDASELLHYHFSLLKKNVYLICVSQSGESAEIVSILEKLPGDVPCLAVTNEASSTLAEMAIEVLLSKAGPEEMTSTKTYVSIALVKLIFGWALAGKWTDSKKAEVWDLIDHIEGLLASHPTWVPEIGRFFGEYDYIEVIGRGPDYTSVLQGALMFREAVRRPAGGSLGGAFRHGPMEMVREGFRSVVFAPRGHTYDQSLKMAGDIARFNGRVMIITNSDQDLSGKGIHVFKIDVADNYLFSIGGIIPLQFMVNARAGDLGIEPGCFTRGAKITKSE